MLFMHSPLNHVNHYKVTVNCQKNHSSRPDLTPKILLRTNFVFRAIYSSDGVEFRHLTPLPMYSSQSVNSLDSNHQSQEYYHDDTLLAHRSNLIGTGTTAQLVHGYKYGCLRVRFSVCFRHPPPPSPPPPSAVLKSLEVTGETCMAAEVLAEGRECCCSFDLSVKSLEYPPQIFSTVRKEATGRGGEEEEQLYHWHKDGGLAEGYGQPWLPFPAGGCCQQQQGADGLCGETGQHLSIHLNTAALLHTSYPTLGPY